MRPAVPTPPAPTPVADVQFADGRRAGSSTTIRFVVLLIALTFGAANVGEVLKLPWQAAEERCRQEHKAWAYHQVFGPGLPVPEDPLHGEVLELYNSTPTCDGFAPPAGMVGLLAITSLFGLGVALYFLMPYARRFRRGLVPLPLAGNQAVTTEVDALLIESDVRASVLLDPTEYRADGVAFGHAGRRHIELTAGAVLLHGRDPAAFRAIVMHEIGHLRNRDLDVTYLTIGLWHAFVLLTALVVGVLGVNLGDRTTERLPNLTHLAVLWVIVLLTRNGILRAREHEADAYAAERAPEHREALLGLLRRKRL